MGTDLTARQSRPAHSMLHARQAGTGGASSHVTGPRTPAYCRADGLANTLPSQITLCSEPS
jgi:hypothetical protein